MKNIVICIDGTWNAVEVARKDGGGYLSTNVAKLASLVDVQNRLEDGERQLLCYLEGVGTKEDEQISGGAFGWGLSAIILQAYRFIVENYKPGDRLYFFGFSRGAFAVRSLAGLINCSGVVRKLEQEKLDEAMRVYRSKDEAWKAESMRARVFRSQNSWEAQIHMVGVWDTVGSLGSPLLRHHLAKELGWDWLFHNPSLGDHIKHAFHALAIHEKRKPFRPSLWERDAKAKGQDDEGSFEQVWFAGVHSDVGGGYHEAGLSGLALEWMIEKAETCGLVFLDKVSQIAIVPELDPKRRPMRLRTSGQTVSGEEQTMCLHNSYSGSLYPLMGPTFRKFREEIPGKETRESIHPSVLTFYQDRESNISWPDSFSAVLAEMRKSQKK